MVKALDLKSNGVTRVGSNPAVDVSFCRNSIGIDKLVKLKKLIKPVASTHLLILIMLLVLDDRPAIITANLPLLELLAQATGTLMSISLLFDYEVVAEVMPAVEEGHSVRATQHVPLQTQGPQQVRRVERTGH